LQPDLMGGVILAILRAQNCETNPPVIPSVMRRKKEKIWPRSDDVIRGATGLMDRYECLLTLVRNVVHVANILQIGGLRLVIMKRVLRAAPQDRWAVASRNMDSWLSSTCAETMFLTQDWRQTGL